MNTHVGLYLAGTGSLDGSDVYTAVLAYDQIQKRGWDPRPIGRDVKQGEVRNHRDAREISVDRNSLTESARMVRGDIKDMRDVDTDQLLGGVFVGGGGVLSTWTDFHERGKDCRITERLKFHINDFYNKNQPIICLGNAGLAVARVLSDVDEKIQMNPGQNSKIKEAIEYYGIQINSAQPCWDEENRVGTRPGFIREESLGIIRQEIDTLLSLSEPAFEDVEGDHYR
ncbi:MAG: hypothetical protein ABEJ65_02535 [bacterium]